MAFAKILDFLRRLKTRSEARTKFGATKLGAQNLVVYSVKKHISNFADTLCFRQKSMQEWERSDQTPFYVC